MFMKTAISIPDQFYEAAEQLAQRLGLSRSGLYAAAVRRFVAEHRRLEVTERLDQIYSDEAARVDPILDTLQFAALEPEDW